MALVLAAIGLYGLMAFRIGQRAHELGVRMALGASAAAIVADVLGGAARLLLFGSLLGLLGGAVVARVIRTSLFGVGGFDPASFAAAVVLLLLATALAAYLPARRAGSIDPAVVLRDE